MLKSIDDKRDAVVFYGAMLLALSLLVSDWWVAGEAAPQIAVANSRSAG